MREGERRQQRAYWRELSPTTLDTCTIAHIHSGTPDGVLGTTVLIRTGESPISVHSLVPETLCHTVTFKHGLWMQQFYEKSRCIGDAHHHVGKYFFDPSGLRCTLSCIDTAEFLVCSKCRDASSLRLSMLTERDQSLIVANGMVSNHNKNVVITAFVSVFTVLIQAHSNMCPLLR